MFKSRQIEEEIEFEDFCAFPNVFYKTVGLDFIDMAETTTLKEASKEAATSLDASVTNGRSRKPKWLRNLMHFYMAIVFFCFGSSSFYMNKQLNVVIESGNLAQLIRLATFITFQLNSNVKFFAFIANYKNVCHIYSELKQSFPQNAKARRDYQLKKHFWPLPVQFIVGVYIFICIVIDTAPIVQAICQYFYQYFIWKFGGGQAAPIFVCLRIVPIEYDFDVCTPLRYTLVSLYEVLACYYSPAIAMGTDLWLVLVLSQICMHFDYIGNELKAYQPQPHNIRKDCAFLLGLIKKQQKMFDLSGKLNNIVGISLVISLFSTTSLFCSMSVQLVTEDMGIDVLFFALLFISITVQFFLLCSSGQLIIDMSQNIGTAAYENSWYNGSQIYKKMLLLIMVRAQKPVELTANQFHTISLETFQIVMGMTYRLFTLLLTMLK